MAESSSIASSSAVRPVTASVSQQELIPGKPTEQIGIDTAAVNDPVPAPPHEEEYEYPQGLKLWLNLISIAICCFTKGMDLTVVAVAVPALTNEFKTLSDIGWYNAAYGMVLSATVFFFGKVYTLFDMKKVFLASTVVFWLGSVVCTFANSSKVFVFGRALAGLGNSAQGAGLMNIVVQSLPVHKRAMPFSIFSFISGASMVIAPILGGVLITKFTWRACFGINIPLGIITLLFSWYGVEVIIPNDDLNLPFREKVKRLDLIGTALIIPSITSLLIAFQYGGITYGWGNPRIIVLLVVSVVLFGLFAYRQYSLGEKATIPPRIIKNRTILGGAWFTTCCDGTLATTEYFMAIYFQGVRGFTAAKSGLLGVPMIVGLSIAALVSGATTNWLGYYNPAMIATSVVAPIAAGLLTTLDLDSNIGKAAGLIGMLGFAIGLGLQGPMMAVGTVLNARDVSLGNAVLTFGGGMGSSLFITAAATLFQTRLAVEVSQSAPGINITTIEKVGLSDIRKAIGGQRLKQVLFGYDEALTQTMYFPLALTILTLAGAVAIEWRSVKKKAD